MNLSANADRMGVFMKIIHVSKTGQPDGFSTITAAIESLPADNTDFVSIYIEPGIYREKITIDRPFITFLGTGAKSDDVVITYDDYAYDLMPDGMKRGTFRSYSVLIDTHDITMKNLTIENASGDSATHGQALALYADGDRLFFDNIRLLGHQDTLFTGPLPPKEKEPNGFIGPKQYSPRINGRHYYKNCYICGDVDFIFGSATAYFEDCVIESLSRYEGSDAYDENGTPKIQGYVTAASTAEGQEYGYVFSNCKLIGPQCPNASVYLGRPWREFAKTIFLNCEFGPHIHPERFHDWNKKDAHGTIFYAEYANHPAPDAPAGFVHLLSPSEAIKYTKDAVLSGDDKWSV